MHETLCFSIQSASPNVELVKERAKKELAKKEFVRERVSQRNCSLTVNGIASGAGGGVADGVLKEVSHEMRF